MKRRVVGAILCLILISVSASATYAAFPALDSGITIYLEPSFFSIDIFDDFADAGYPAGIINRSVREKAHIKVPLGFKVKLPKFDPQALLTPRTFAQSFSSQQELYRYHEVFRI